jgi:hypothetical protein
LLIRGIIFVLLFVAPDCVIAAKDDSSIKGLSDALVALASSVDRNEAELIASTVHKTSRELAHEYRVTGPPAFQNFLIHIGVRQRGYCFDFVRDIGARLKELKPRTLVLHWGESFANTNQENNGLVLTARGQRFQDGVVLDAWRHGGRLYWRSVQADRQNVWKENLHETALLQSYGSNHKERLTSAPTLLNEQAR